MINSPKVTIIVVTHNSENFIDSCLKSVLKQDYKNFELIVVDNKSEDSTLELINNFKTVKLIKNLNNFGVCFARNQVIKTVNSKYILTLDADVILTKNFISKMVEHAEKSPPYIGMWGGRVLCMRQPQKIDTLGIILTRIYRFYDAGQGRDFNSFKTNLAKVIGPCACSAMYKRELLEDIKESDSNYFASEMHYLIEDFDLALRAREKGWGFKFIPDAIAYHYRGGSKFNRKYLQYLSFRNRYYLMLRHFKKRDLPYLILALLFYDLPRILYLLTTNYSNTKLALKEIIFNFKCKK